MIEAQEQAQAQQALSEEEKEKIQKLFDNTEKQTAAPEEDAASYDVEIDNMVWEVESEEPEPEEQQTYVDTGSSYQYYDSRYDDLYGTNRFGRRVRIARKINKHLFTWVFSFFLGIYGADRFVRGQIGLGLLKLLTFGGFGFWYFADLLIAAGKSYSGEYRYDDDVLFDSMGNYVH